MAQLKRDVSERDKRRDARRTQMFVKMILEGKTLKFIADKFDRSVCFVEQRVRYFMFDYNTPLMKIRWSGYYDWDSNTSPNKKSGLGTVRLLRLHHKDFGL